MIVLKEKNKGNAVTLQCGFEYKDLCSQVPNGRWDKTNKCWVYPIESLLVIKEVFKGNNVSMDKSVADILRSYEGRNNILNAIKEGEYQLPQHPFLMNHQRACREIARYYNRFAFFLDTGTGKTLTALQIIEDKGHRFIVICPKANIKSAWVEDQEKFFPDMRMMPLSRNMSKEDYIKLCNKWGIKTKGSKDDLKKVLINHAQCYIINPESFKSDIKDIEGIDGISGIIFDESTIIKNPQSQICKEVTEYAGKLEFAYILTGKPNPNGLLDYFSQMRIVDPCLLVASFYYFKNMYFYQTGYMGYDLKPKDNSEQLIAQRIAYKSIVISKEDCLDLPEKTYIRYMVQLNSKARKYYNEMERTQIINVQDNNISVPNKLACVMKLRQITSGFVMFEDSPIVPNTNGLDKLAYLKNLLEEIGDKPVIIWAQFKAEIEMIEHMLNVEGKTVVTAYSGTKDLDDSVRRFKHGEAQYMVAHPKTLQFGVTFVQCNYAIYFSRSYDFQEYYQSHDRIYRKGQVNKCTFIMLIAEDTVDEVIDSVIEEKGEAASVIEKLIKLRE